MTEEEVVTLVPTLAPSDHKRKLEGLEPEAPERPDHPDESNAELDEDKTAQDELSSDSTEAKRPRLDENRDMLGSENGLQTDKQDEQVKDNDLNGVKLGNEQAEEGEPSLEEVDVTLETKEVKLNLETEEVEVNTVKAEEKSAEDHGTIALQEASPENDSNPETASNTENASKTETDSKTETASNTENASNTESAPSNENASNPETASNTENAQERVIEESKEVNEDVPQEISDTETNSHKIDVPSSKVGVLIGKGGDTIRYLQYNSGAKIQIMRDAEADPSSLMRSVELIGTLISIEKAERLINAVIAEADAGGSPSLVARGLPSGTTQAAGAADNFEITVANEKVGLIIGRGGENIKNMQAKSGARIQLIPQHLPEGDVSKERIVRVTGDRKQIEIAKELINDVMNQTVRSSSLSSGSNQQSNRSRGPTGPPHWGPRGQHQSQSMGYDYHQRGQPPSQNHHYNQPQSYGSYPPQQMAPRNNYGAGWEQRPPSMQGPPQHNSGYDYYVGQHHAAPGHASAPISGHASGPSPSPAMGPPPSQGNFNYGQSHGPDYGPQASYSQTHQQSYGHMYEEQKYENHAPIQQQQPYGGHGGSQQGYAHTGGQQGYAPQQQYGKPLAYGTQGPPNQTYGPSRVSQPGDMVYQGTGPAAPSYGQIPQQQQYPYTSGGPVQQTYPTYGSVPPTDGYSQPPPTGQGYAPQSGQPVQGGQPGPNYNQPGGQQVAGYGQTGPTSGYGSYPTSQQGYTEQPATNAANYGYQAPQDPSYVSGAAGQTYGAPSQAGYAQGTAGQPGYDQSVTQSGGYGTTPASAPASYGDSNQIYSATR